MGLGCKLFIHIINIQILDKYLLHFCLVLLNLFTIILVCHTFHVNTNWWFRLLTEQ